MSEEELEAKLVFYNPWWQQHSVPHLLVPPFKRAIFQQLLKYFKLPRIIILKGPRRTGKSTLMYQLIQHFIDQDVKPQNILYLNFEDPLLRADLFELFSLFEKLLKEPLEKGQDKYIFLDEVHLLPDWAPALKAIFDKKYPIKFVCSGSAATLLHKSSESLAGRTIEEVVFPFSFGEYARYQLFKSRQKEEINANNYVIFQKQIALLWEKYLLKGGFAHLLEIEDKTILQKLVYEDVVQKVIYKDLVDLYGIREPQVMEKVFYYLVNTSSRILTLTTLASTVGINRETLRLYLSYLKNAYLYFELYKYSRSVKQSLASSVKVHLIDPGFFNLSTPNLPIIWETAIVSHFYYKFPRKIYYWRETEEVDLVWQKNTTLVPIEIKSSKSIEKKALKGLLKFLDRFKTNEGWVVYSGVDRTETIGNKTLKFFNAPKLLYLTL